jgi:chorismate mutase
MKGIDDMKNYEVEAVKCFTDKEECARRNVGDNFFCTEERYRVLKQKGAVKLLGVQTSIDDITEEEVQAVAVAIVEEAQEQDKTIEEVVNEIVEESKEEVKPKPKKKKSSNK